MAFHREQFIATLKLEQVIENILMQFHLGKKI